MEPKTPKGKIVVIPQGQPRQLSSVSPSTLSSAERSAEGGNLLQWAQLTEWVLRDDRVTATLNGSINPILSKFPKFGDDEKVSEELTTQFPKLFPESKLREMLQWGIVAGMSLHQIPWEELDRPGVQPVSPQQWNLGDLAWSWDKYQYSLSSLKDKVIKPGDGQWMLFTPFGSYRPWAKGLLSKVAPWVLLKHYARLDWARHSEKSARIIGEAEKDVEIDEADRQKLADDLYGAGGNAVVILPPGVKAKLLELQANTQAIYQAQIEAANLAISIAIDGHNLTTEVGSGGSYSAAQTALEVRLANSRAIAEALSTTLREQYLIYWAVALFGDADKAPYPEWDVLPPEDRNNLADLLFKAAQSVQTLTSAGVKVDIKRLSERLGFDFLS